METAFDEIRSLNDLRLTLEVQFYNEVFFLLMNIYLKILYKLKFSM